MKILELYSGIGGMHYAIKEAEIQDDIVAAIDINTVANKVYNHNFPKTNLLNKNIQSISAKFINKLNIDFILMSPPCQPFSRNGLQGDTKDHRTDSFLHIISILPDLNTLKYILIENVKGFETSSTRNILIEMFDKTGYVFQEFIISPVQIGVPNSRHRYYCLAKKKPLNFSFKTAPLMYSLPNQKNDEDLFDMSNIIDKDINVKEYLLNEKNLCKYLEVLDICYPDSKRSCCFTKAYGRYLEGTGSIYTPLNEEEFKSIIKRLSETEKASQEYLNMVNLLKLRYFTPMEIARLMCFPEDFKYPADITNKQKYRLLGNSINVKVVSELIKIVLQ